MKLMLLVIAITQFANPLIYPQHDKTPGVTNPLVSQANIRTTSAGRDSAPMPIVPKPRTRRK